MSGAFLEGFHKRQARYAAATPLSLAEIVEPDNKGRPMKLLHQTGSDNPYHTRMPISRSHNNCRIPFWQKRFRKLLQSLDERPLFHGLAIAILPIQVSRQHVC